MQPVTGGVLVPLDLALRALRFSTDLRSDSEGPSIEVRWCNSRTQGVRRTCVI